MLIGCPDKPWFVGLKQEDNLYHTITNTRRMHLFQRFNGTVQLVTGTQGVPSSSGPHTTLMIRVGMRLPHRIPLTHAGAHVIAN